MDQPYPQPTDAVLGGRSATPIGAVVLGGFDGMKRRLLSPDPTLRQQAVTEAMRQGDRGLTLVIRALYDSAPIVQETAYQFLRDRPEPEVQQAIERYLQRQRYAPLQRLLQQQRWQQADLATRLALFQAANLNPCRNPPPHPARIAECPTPDLHLIDRLWVRASRGQFGFSVQRRLWQPIDQLYWDKADVWLRFGERVGWCSGGFLSERQWKRYDQLTFSQLAPPGHLPFLGEGFGIFTVEALCDRLNPTSPP